MNRQICGPARKTRRLDLRVYCSAHLLRVLQIVESGQQCRVGFDEGYIKKTSRQVGVGCLRQIAASLRIRRSPSGLRAWKSTKKSKMIDFNEADSTQLKPSDVKKFYLSGKGKERVLDGIIIIWLTDTIDKLKWVKGRTNVLILNLLDPTSTCDTLIDFNDGLDNYRIIVKGSKKTFRKKSNPMKRGSGLTEQKQAGALESNERNGSDHERADTSSRTAGCEGLISVNEVESGYDLDI